MLGSIYNHPAQLCDMSLNRHSNVNCYCDFNISEVGWLVGWLVGCKLSQISVRNTIILNPSLRQRCAVSVLFESNISSALNT